MAARRLLGPPADGHSAEGGCTFTRLLPRPAPNADAGQALLEGVPTAPDRELQRQDAELLRALESVRERDRELESLKREVEETNQGKVSQILRNLVSNAFKFTETRSAATSRESSSSGTAGR